MSIWSILFGHDSFAFYESDDEREAYSSLTLRLVREEVGHIYVFGLDNRETRQKQRAKLDALDLRLSRHDDPKMRRAWRYWGPHFYRRMREADFEGAKRERVDRIKRDLHERIKHPAKP